MGLFEIAALSTTMVHMRLGAWLPWQITAAAAVAAAAGWGLYELITFLMAQTLDDADRWAGVLAGILAYISASVALILWLARKPTRSSTSQLKTVTVGYIDGRALYGQPTVNRRAKGNDPMEKKWDLFISHASEDAKTVAVPLAEALDHAGLRVWLDKQQLRIGDSLRQKIDEGLAQSRFGVVILSPRFLEKKWPQRELDGLMAIEDGGINVILPVWHEIDPVILAAFSPLLAGRIAANTKNGLAAVAASIADVVLHKDSNSPSLAVPTLRRRFLDLLGRSEQASDVKAFLLANQDIVTTALNSRDRLLADLVLGTVAVDFCVGRFWHTTAMWRWQVLMLGPINEPPLTARDTPSVALASLMSHVETARVWLRSHSAPADLHDVTSEFKATIVMGRRHLLTNTDVEALREFNDFEHGLVVRTYDWLTEAASTRGEVR